MKYIKMFEDINFDEWDEEETNNDIVRDNDFIDWPFEINNEDVERYNIMIEDMLTKHDLDYRMELCDNILSEIEEQYPNQYYELEESIRDLIFY